MLRWLRIEIVFEINFFETQRRRWTVGQLFIFVRKKILLLEIMMSTFKKKKHIQLNLFLLNKIFEFSTAVAA